MPEKRLTQMDTGRPTAKQAAIKAVEQEDREPTVRLNANVPKSFMKRLKAFALEHDTTVTKLVIGTLKERMSR